MREQNRKLAVLRSFLKNRRFLVEVQGKKSVIQPLGNISVVQGSKNASFLYTAYNLEVVYLPKLMNMSQDFKEITGEESENHENISHYVFQYIDNSNNSIAANSTTELIDYTEKYISY